MTTNDRIEPGVCPSVDCGGSEFGHSPDCAYMNALHGTGQQTAQPGSGKAAERLRALQRAYGCIPRIGAELNRDVAEVLADLTAAKADLSRAVETLAELERDNWIAQQHIADLERNFAEHQAAWQANNAHHAALIRDLEEKLRQQG